MISIECNVEDRQERAMERRLEAVLKFIETDYSETLRNVIQETKKEALGQAEDSDPSDRRTDEGQEEVQPEEEAQKATDVMVCPNVGKVDYCDICEHRSPHSHCHECDYECENGVENTPACARLDQEPCAGISSHECCNKDGCQGYQNKVDGAKIEYADALGEAVYKRRRMQSIKAILDEVRYQEKFQAIDKSKDIDDWVNLASVYLAKARFSALVLKDEPALENIRKAAAVLASCMLNLGIRKRR